MKMFLNHDLRSLDARRPVRKGPGLFPRLLLAAALLGSGPADLRAEVLMANGSRLEGQLEAVEGETARLRLAHGEVLVPLDSLDGKWLAAQAQKPDTGSAGAGAGANKAPGEGGVAAAPADEASLPLEARVQILEAKVAALEAKVQALRAELALAQSRAEAAGSPAPSSPAPAPAVDRTATALSLSAPVPPSGPAAVPTETGYWLTASGVRHNRTCRYYMKAKGQPCRPDEGRPCSKCGG